MGRNSIGLALALLVCATGCSRAPAPNFVLIVLDDVGYGHLGAYDETGSVRTPHLDRIAQEGMRFDAAFVTTPSCSPSRASILTSLYPHQTGARALNDPLPATTPIFPTLLREAGYFTAAAGKLHLGDDAASRFDRSAPKVESTGTLDWVGVLEARPRDRPFFLWLGSVDPHRPLRAPTGRHRERDVPVPPYLVDGPKTRNEFVRYFDEIAGIDDVVGEVFAELERQGVADETVVIVVSDNGSPFPRAKMTLYDSGVRTPLIVRWPGHVEPASRNPNLVSTIDLAPTILEIAGIAPPAHYEGRSLVGALRDPSTPTRDPIFLERNFHGFFAHERGVRSERYLYLRNTYPFRAGCARGDIMRSATGEELRAAHAAGRLTPGQARCFRDPRGAEELYDVARDPHAFDDLVADPAHTATLETMRGQLDAWIARTGDGLGTTCGGPREISCLERRWIEERGQH